MRVGVRRRARSCRRGAGTARHVRGLLGALAGRPGLELQPLSLRRARPGRDARPRCRLVPARDRPRRPRSRRPPLHDHARAAARAPPRRRHRPRSRRAPLSRTRFRSGTACTGRLALRTACGARTPSSPCPRSRARARRRCSMSRRDRMRVVPNGVDPVFTPDGEAAEGDYVLAVGTLEPRKNLGACGRGCAARRRRAPGRRGARVGRRRRARLGRTRLTTRSSRRSIRGARCLVLPSLYEGFGHARARGDGMRDAGRHERAAAPPRRSPAAPPCSSTRSTRRLSRPGSPRPSAGVTSSCRSGSSAPGVHVGAGGRRSRALWRELGVSAPARRRRRRCARPPSHGRRDLRPQPAARAGAARGRGRPADRRGDAPARSRPGRDRADRADDAEPGAADGLGAAAAAPRVGAALVHTQYALPLRCPCPAVVTIHDLSFERDAA